MFGKLVKILLFIKMEQQLNTKSKLQQKVEFQLFELLDDAIYDSFETDGYYNFIKNPKTNKSLQLDILVTFKERIKINDIYIPIRLAIEVQGTQHFKFIESIHKEPKDFRSLQYRDKIKMEQCISNNIILIPLSYKKIRKSSFDLKSEILTFITNLSTKKYPQKQYLFDLFDKSFSLYLNKQL